MMGNWGRGLLFLLYDVGFWGDGGYQQEHNPQR